VRDRDGHLAFRQIDRTAHGRRTTAGVARSELRQLFFDQPLVFVEVASRRPGAPPSPHGEHQEHEDHLAGDMPQPHPKHGYYGYKLEGTFVVWAGPVVAHTWYYISNGSIYVYQYAEGPVEGQVTDVCALFGWPSSGLTDIQHQGQSPGKDVQNGDHGEEEASSASLVHSGVQD